MARMEAAVLLLACNVLSWSLAWGCVLITDELSGQRVFYSQDFDTPVGYPRNSSCNFTVTIPDGTSLTITALTFSLRHKKPNYIESILGVVGWSDRVDIIENSSGLRIGSFRNDVGPKGLVSAGNSITIVLTTLDRDISGSSGFGKVAIEIKRYEKFPKIHACPEKNSTLIAQNQFCDGIKDCPDGSDEFCRKDCGHQAVKPDWESLEAHTRIVNGSIARAHSWPWQVAFEANGNLICGGSLIAPQWVMTAAHCCDVEGLTTSMITIVTGAHNRNQYPSEASTRSTKVKKMYIHPKYEDSPMIIHDFCLLHLEKAVSLTAKTYPVCLPTGNFTDQPEGAVCYVTGWGATQHGVSSSPDILRQAPSMVHDQSKCAAQYDGGITQEMLCGYNRMRDTCQGDSGGPFVCKMPGDVTRFELTGVTSWGYKCAVDGYPGVYGRTLRSMDWIASTIHAARYEGWYNGTSFSAPSFVLLVILLSFVMMIQ